MKDFGEAFTNSSLCNQGDNLVLYSFGLQKCINMYFTITMCNFSPNTRIYLSYGNNSTVNLVERNRLTNKINRLTNLIIVLSSRFMMTHTSISIFLEN